MPGSAIRRLSSLESLAPADLSWLPRVPLLQRLGQDLSAVDLYQLFRDPHSAFDTQSRPYSFMTIGPVSPLSFSGSPLFVNAFNTVDAFLDANRLGAT